MRIDAAHLYSDARDPAGLLPILQRNRFDGSVLIQPAASHSATEAALAQALETGFIKAVSVWVDLNSAEWQKLEANPKCTGICVHLRPHLDLSEPVRRGLAIDLLTTPDHLPMVESLAALHPRATLILSAMGNPEISASGLKAWAAGIQKLSRHGNIALKLSHLTRLAHPTPWSAAELTPFVQHAINCLGPDRLLFGSGWPEILPAASWKESLAAFTQSIGAHSIGFREEILGGTACRLYKVAE